MIIRTFKNVLRHYLPTSSYQKLRYAYQCRQAPQLTIRDRSHQVGRMPYFHFYGDYAEVGRQIAATFDLKKIILTRSVKATEIESLQYHQNFLKIIFPEYLDLLAGVAEHYALSLQQVLAFNMSPLFSTDYAIACSSAYIPSLHWFIQNLDLGMTNETIAARIDFADGKRWLGHLSLPYLWPNFGINQAGVFLGGSSVTLEDTHGDTAGIPVFIAAWYLLLRAQSTQDVLKLLDQEQRLPHQAGWHMLVGDDDRVVRLEIGHDRFTAYDHNLVTTNHFRDSTLVARHDQRNVHVCTLLAASRQRYDHFQQQATTLTNKQALQNFLRDSTSLGSWCQRDHGHTTASYFLDLNQLTCDFAIGFPQSSTLPHHLSFTDMRSA